MVARSLIVAICALGVLPSLALAAVPRRARPLIAGLATSALGIAGITLGVQCVRSGLTPVRVSWLLPLSGVQVAGDALSGTFTIVTPTGPSLLDGGGRTPDDLVGQAHEQVAPQWSACGEHRCTLPGIGLSIDILAPGAFLSLIVPLIVFLVFQRFFVRRVMAGSVK